MSTGLRPCPGLDGQAAGQTGWVGRWDEMGRDLAPHMGKRGPDEQSEQSKQSKQSKQARPGETRRSEAPRQTAAERDGVKLTS
jgi:hypothetical protein